MRKAAVAVSALLVIGAWTLDAASVVKDERWLLIPGTVAVLMLIWAEWQRHDLKTNTDKRIRELQDQVALNASVDPAVVRCEPSIIYEPRYRGGSLRIRLTMNREIKMDDGLRCRVEDPGDHVTCAEHRYPVIRKGETIEFAFPGDFAGAKRPTTGLYVIVWEQAINPEFHPMKFCTYRWSFYPTRYFHTGSGGE